MSAFSSLPVFLQTLIPLLLFVEAVLELGLLYINSRIVQNRMIIYRVL